MKNLIRKLNQYLLLMLMRKYRIFPGLNYWEQNAISAWIKIRRANSEIAGELSKHHPEFVIESEETRYFRKLMAEQEKTDPEIAEFLSSADLSSLYVYSEEKEGEQSNVKKTENVAVSEEEFAAAGNEK